jgi:hypothetical protein
MINLIIEDCYQPEFIQGLQNDLKCATPIERTACNVSILKSVNYFYKFRFQSFCGFKQVKLLGEKDDWLRLREKVLALKKYNFEPTESTLQTEEKQYSTQKVPENAQNLHQNTATNTGLKPWEVNHINGHISRQTKWSD